MRLFRLALRTNFNSHLTVIAICLFIIRQMAIMLKVKIDFFTLGFVFDTTMEHCLEHLFTNVISLIALLSVP